MNEKEKIVIEKFKKGQSVGQIAKDLNLSRQGVYNILIRKNIKYKKDKKTIEIERLEEELKHNDIKEIMEKYDLPYHYIRSVMKKNNLQKSELMSDILNKKDIERLYKEKGFTDGEIAKVFNCSPHTIRSFRWQNDIYNKNRQWQRELDKETFRKLQTKYNLREISEITGFPYHIIVRANKIYNE